MEIKVLGPGCAKCKTTYQVIEKVIKENNLDVKLTKVDDIMEMMNYNIMTTPAVVVDEVVKIKGHVPTESEVKTLLFLARITENKGVFIALDTFKILQQTHEELQLKVVGGGPDLERVKQYVAQNEIRNVFFTGPLDGEQVSEAFVQSDLYLFPTFHAEGMPTSVLEAMAFGLPVITRPVGGLVDFFVNGQMGEMIDSFDANDLLWLLKSI